jgi:hypothetical protein
MMNDIDLLLTNEIHNYLIAFEEVKVRFPAELRLPMFDQLIAHVTLYALRKIYPQYKMLIDRPTMISRCTHVFTTITELPCSHKIHQRMYEKEENRLLLKDVHMH